MTTQWRRRSHQEPGSTTSLPELGVDDLISWSDRFEELQRRSSNMEEVAAHITAFVRDGLVDPAGRPACPLVQLYATHRLGALPPERQDFARRLAAEPVSAATRCLTLLGAAGEEPAGRDAARPTAMPAIPLTSAPTVERSPAVAPLLDGLGVDVGSLVRAGGPSPGDHHGRYDVFHLPEAGESPFVAAQRDLGVDVPRGVRSVVGCGGLLPGGDLFALVLYTAVTVSQATAELFRTVAFTVKSAIIPFTVHVFAR